MRRLNRGVLVAGLALLLLGAAGWRFRLFLELPANVVRYESPKSLTQLASWLYYLHSYLVQMRWNEATGQKDLAAAAEALAASDPDDLFENGRMAWHRADFDRAVDLIEAHHAAHGETEHTLLWLGLAYMRVAEATNCFDPLVGPVHDHASMDHGGMCSLPLTVHHQDPTYARKAAAVFTRLLDEYDADDPVYRWLLNFTHMTVDGFPHEVPERYRIDTPFVDQFYGAPGAEMARKYADLRMVDRAGELGVNKVSTSGGVAVEDFDGDGFLDVVVGSSFGDLTYFRNDGAGGFDDATEAAGLAGIHGTHMMTAADYDNDGRVDLFVSRVFGSARGDFLLLRNLGGRFDDVTVSSGLLPPADAREDFVMTWASGWGDIDADGDLDLFVGFWGLYNGTDASMHPNPFARNKQAALFRNDGGHFVDVTEAWGIDDVVRGRSVFGASFGDYDADGFVDLVITPQWLPSAVLLHNEGGTRFARTDLLENTSWGFMSAFVDVNHDGRLDVFVGGNGSAYGITAQTVFGVQEGYRNESTVWMQNADGTFTSHPEYFRGGMLGATMGSNFGDLDNNGAYDFYLGTGSPEPWLVMPNLMYMGVTEGGAATGVLDNVTMLQGLGTIQKGHGVVFFDYDNDGDQDIYSSLGGMWRADAWPDQFWVNESTYDHTWTKLRLRGTRANRFGAGSRIRVVVDTPRGQQREHWYHLDNQTGFGSAPYLAHLGLGDAVGIDRVEVYWPGRTRPSVHAAELEALNVLVEPQMAVQRAR